MQNQPLHVHKRPLCFRDRYDFLPSAQFPPGASGYWFCPQFISSSMKQQKVGLKLSCNAPSEWLV